MVVDIETDWCLPTQGIKPHTISILKSRSTGKSSLQLAYNMQLIWDEYVEFNMHKEMIMEKIHYQHFTRLYNRKKYQTFGELAAAGYTRVKTSGYHKQRDWCKANLKPGSFASSTNVFWFAYDSDAVLFKMHWL